MFTLASNERHGIITLIASLKTTPFKCLLLLNHYYDVIKKINVYVHKAYIAYGH